MKTERASPILSFLYWRRWQNAKGVLAALVVSCLLSPEVRGSGAVSGVASGVVEFNSVAVALDFRGGSDPAAILRVDRIRRDFQRRAFFRIGALPVVVFEGVTLDVLHPERASDISLNLAAWTGRGGGAATEIRGLKVRIAPSPDPVLESGCARVMTSGCLELFGGVRCLSGTNELRAARGTFFITGDNAGRFILQTTPAWTNDYFHAKTKPGEKEARGEPGKSTPTIR
jgi:hypothetical protein